MELLVFVALCLVLDYLALRWAADSRDDFRAPARPIALSRRRPGLF